MGNYHANAVAFIILWVGKILKKKESNPDFTVIDPTDYGSLSQKGFESQIRIRDPWIPFSYPSKWNITSSDALLAPENFLNFTQNIIILVVVFLNIFSNFFDVQIRYCSRARFISPWLSVRFYMLLVWCTRSIRSGYYAIFCSWRYVSSKNDNFFLNFR